MRIGRLASLLTALALAASLSGCSMSAQWFIQKSLRDAGFSRAEARCAVEGVASRLDRDQLGSVRAPLIGYVMLDEPAERMDVDRLLAWLEPRLEPDVHRVLAHYARQCRQGRG